MQYFDIDGNVVEKPEGVEAVWRPSVYGLYVKNRAVLMCSSKLHDFWEFPGGGIEEGESFEDALKREFEEEAQLKIVSFEKIPYHFVQRNAKFINGKFYKTLLFYYLITDVESGAERAEGENIVSAEFIDLNSPPENLHIAHKEAFEFLRKNI
jgi:8-oxo-dGTP pyrophosphatase MutT (NUDIX family)